VARAPKQPGPVVGLDDLVAYVHAAHPEGDPLMCLGEAVQVAQHLGELGDHLIGHFVDQARRSGATWSAIGQNMGVTKQAAQQRFVDIASDGAAFSRFTVLARAAITQAQKEARRSHSGAVGTEHLLVGLIAQPEGLAAKAIASMGVSTRKLRAAIKAMSPPQGAADVEGRLPFSPRAKKVLELAVREALRRGHNYVGTEHLLLAVLDEGEGIGAKALLELGVTRPAASACLDELLAAVVAARGGS
jgi:hypothetical protein